MRNPAALEDRLSKGDSDLESYENCKLSSTAETHVFLRIVYMLKVEDVGVLRCLPVQHKDTGQNQDSVARELNISPKRSEAI